MREHAVPPPGLAAPVLPTLLRAALLLAALALGGPLPGGPTPVHGQSAAPSLLVAPVGSEEAPNLAAEVTARIRAGVDSLALFEQVDWDALLARSSLTRTLDPERRASLGCIQARQIAHAEPIDLVRCMGVWTSADGLVVQADLFDVASGERMPLGTTTVPDRDGVVRQVLEALGTWRPERGRAEAD